MSPGWAEDWCRQWLRASPLRSNFRAMGAAVFWECPRQNIVPLNNEDINHSMRSRVHEWPVNLTFSSCEVKDGKQLALDLGSELNQLTTSIQILVTGNHLQYDGKYKFISETRYFHIQNCKMLQAVLSCGLLVNGFYNDTGGPQKKKCNITAQLA